MEQPVFPVEGMENPSGGQASPTPVGDSDAPARKGPQGRKKKPEEVARYLASHGLMAVPTPEPGTGPGDDAGADAGSLGEGAGGFDAETTRATAGFLVGAYSQFKADTFATAALTVTGDATTAEDYRRRAELSDAKTEAVVEATVEICRKNGVTLSPELSLAVIALNEVREFRALRTELAALARARGGSGGTNGGRP